jgi:sugar phosphate isomerase/epimerase
MAAHRPKHVETLKTIPFDWVVTIGDNARDGTPDLPGNPRRIHWPVPDPADADGTPQQQVVFRQALTAIEQRLDELLKTLESSFSARELHLQAGISTCIVRPGRFDPPVHIPLLAKAGFACIELNCNFGSDDFPWDRPGKVRELARIAEASGIRVFSVHAEGRWLPPEDPKARRTALDMAKTYADLAAELGALVVPIHAGLPRGMEREAAEECLRQALSELEAHALPMPCRFGWENEAMGLTAKEHLEWLGRLNPGAFGLVLDTGHAHIAGDLDTYLGSAGLRLCDLHLNANDGKHDHHFIPGQGTLNWSGFMEKLSRTGYTDPLMLEVEARDRQGELESVLQECRAAVEMLKNPTG